MCTHIWFCTRNLISKIVLRTKKSIVVASIYWEIHLRDRSVALSQSFVTGTLAVVKINSAAPKSCRPYVKISRSIFSYKYCTTYIL